MRNLDPYYVTGFVEGEGSFYVGILPKNLEKVKWEVRPSFSLSQNKENKKILFKLKEFFGCGWIRPSRKDNTLKYEVRSLKELDEKIIPHFEKHPLVGEKEKDFEILKKVVRMMRKRKHLEKDGLKEIIELTLKMTRNPKRIKSLQKIYTLLKE
jgi:hypothetical protein